jgi:pectate lyase
VPLFRSRNPVLDGLPVSVAEPTGTPRLQRVHIPAGAFTPPIWLRYDRDGIERVATLPFRATRFFDELEVFSGVPVDLASSRIVVHEASGNPWGWVNTKAQRAFPGAEGWGAETTHARNEVGAQVLRVINLNDSGAGSLRSALLTPNPRVVIFDVSGQINLLSDIDPGAGYAAYSNLAVFGQTAPSPGITIAGAEIVIRQSDVVVQHLRSRRGGLQTPSTQNFIVTTSARRVVIDHMSISWSTDDNILAWVSPTDITFSNTISSECNKGLLIGQGAQRVASIRNLFSHCWDRVPMAKGGTNVIYVNNYVYNCGFSGNGSPIKLEGTDNPGASLVSVIGVVAKDGVSNAGFTGLFVDFNPGSKLYLDDNVLTRVPPINDTTSFDWSSPSPPFALPSPLGIIPSAQLETRMVNDLGARPLDRDAVDVRILNNVVNGTGRHIEHFPFGTEDENDVGGYPSLAENTYLHENDSDWIALGLTDPSNHFKKDTHPFYSRIELYIAKWTAQVQDVSLIPDV